MPRPPKCRRVEQMPGFTFFKPSGVPLAELSEVVLSVEELEAIRLRDLVGLEHEDCAEKMEVSRQTFQRILVNGAALKIAGGNFRLSNHLLECQGCGHRWEGTICCRRTVCPACAGKNWHSLD